MNSSISVEALNQFLTYDRRGIENDNNNNKHSEEAIDHKINHNTNRKIQSPKPHSVFCSINNPSKEIFHIGNGEEYYNVKLTCNDNTEYGIQAYGEEARQLYREVTDNVVAFSPKVHSDRNENGEGRDNNVMEMTSTTKLKEEDKHQQEIRKEIDYMKHYSFPENNIGCLLIFKKLKNVCLSKKKVLGSSFE
jgi:hypothetical protein